MEDLRYIVLKDTTVEIIRHEEGSEWNGAINAYESYDRTISEDSFLLKAGEIGNRDLRHDSDLQDEGHNYYFHDNESTDSCNSYYSYDKNSLLFFDDVDFESVYYKPIKQIKEIEELKEDISVYKGIIEALDSIINEFKDVYEMPTVEEYEEIEEDYKNGDFYEPEQMFDDSGFAYICGGVSSYEFMKCQPYDVTKYSAKSNYVSNECFKLLNKIYGEIANNPLNKELEWYCGNMTPLFYTWENGKPKLTTIFEKYEDKLEIIISEYESISQKLSKAVKRYEILEPQVEILCNQIIERSKIASQYDTAYKIIKDMNEEFCNEMNQKIDYGEEDEIQEIVKCVQLTDFPQEGIAMYVVERCKDETSYPEFTFSFETRQGELLAVSSDIVHFYSLADALCDILTEDYRVIYDKSKNPVPLKEIIETELKPSKKQENQIKKPKKINHESIER